MGLCYIPRTRTHTGSAPKERSEIMRIQRSEIERTTRLARLQLSPDELERLRGELGDILTYVDRLAELDASEEAALAPAEGDVCPLRADARQTGLSPEEALSQAPDRRGGHFVAPRVS